MKLFIVILVLFYQVLLALDQFSHLDDLSFLLVLAQLTCLMSQRKVLQLLLGIFKLFFKITLCLSLPVKLSLKLLELMGFLDSLDI